MVKEIIKYPTPLSVQYGIDVRIFDEELFSLIDDLKDTINENNLEGLSAFQVGSYFNVIVVKDKNGEFLELINPRMISHKNKITTTETTTYYGDLSAEVSRYKDISIIYQDREAKNSSLSVSDDLAILIQRKLDYTFGATFLQKLAPEQRDVFEAKLQYGANIGVSDYCPTTFQRDKILKVINVGMILMFLAFIASFFISEVEELKTIWEYQLYASYGVLALNVIYFFYAQHEGKKYTSCTSCQIGNIIGTASIVMIKLTLIMVLSYFFINPL